MSRLNENEFVPAAHLVTWRCMRLHSTNRNMIVLGTLIAAALMAALVWGYQSHIAVLSWLLVFTLVMLARLPHMRWLAAQAEVRDYRLHESCFYLAVLATGLCWAFAIFMFSGELPFVLSSMLYVVVGTISAVSVVTLSGSISFFLVLNIPIAYAVFSVLAQQKETAGIMFPQITIFYLVLLLFALHLRRAFIDRISLEIDNENLASAEGARREELRKLNEELEDHVTMRTAELMKTNQQLQESELKFKMAFRSIPDAVVITRLKDGEFIAINDSVYSLTGYRPSELLGRNMTELGFWRNTHEREIFVRLLHRKKAVRGLEIKFTVKSGEVRDCEMSAELCEIGGEACIIGAVRDITDRKRSERALAESNLKFSTVFDHAPNGIVIVNMSGEIIKVNRKYCEILGYQEHELVSKHIKDVTATDDVEPNINLFRNMVDGAINSYQMEKRYIHKAGHLIWVQLNASRIEDKNEQNQYVVAHVVDITARKQAESAIHESEARFRAVFDRAPISMALLDEQGRIQEINEASCQMSGYSRDELLSQSFIDVTHPDYKESSIALHQEMMQGLRSSYRVERKLMSKAGIPKWIDLSVAVITDDEGKPRYRIAHVQDIDLAKELELKLRKSELLYQQAEKMGKLGHWEWDEVEGRMLSCSNEYAQIFNMSEAEILTTHASQELSLQTAHPEDRERLRVAERHAKVNALPLVIEYRIYSKTGELKYVVEQSEFSFDEKGLIVRSFGTLQDVSERKRIELELERNQSLFQQAEELGGLGHWEWDEVEGRLISCSRQYAHMFDRTVAEMMARSSTYELDLQNIHPDDKERVCRSEWASSSDAKPINIEYRIINENGSVRHIHQRGEVEADAEGRPLRSFGTVQDITERKKAELKLKEQKSAFEEAEKIGHLGHWEWDAELDCMTSCSEEYARIHEMSVAECLAFSDSSENDYLSIHPDDRDAYGDYYNAFENSAEPRSIEYRLLTGKGNIRIVYEIIRPVFNAAGELVRYIGTIQDITERVEISERLRETEIQFKHTFNNAPIGMSLVDKNGVIIELNHAAASVIGYAQEEAKGLNYKDLTHPDELEESLQRLRQMLSGDLDSYKVIRRFRHSNGHYVWIDLHCNLVRDAQNLPTYVIAQGIDITEQRSLSEKLSYQASHDSLTDLINRREFEFRLNHMITSARARDSVHTFCYMDLDQFKIINDTFGHAAGDELLRQLCALIQKGVRSRDTLARLGGDEFGLLMEHCPMDVALKTAEALRKSIDDFRFIWHERVLGVGVSMGMVTIDHRSGTTDDLMRAADSACYMAKDQGRNRINVYSETDEATEIRRSEMQWATRIQEALTEDQLFLVGQPIQRLHDNGKGGEFYELLLRMKDDHGNLVSASAMLSAAERYGLITKIDEWVVEKACSSILSNATLLERIALCSINLSGHSLSDLNFLNFIEETVDSFGISPGKICFEITETAAISNFSRATQFMERLRSRGFYFALDDFGTGLSSFAYLKRLPVDYVKIDGAFIRDIAKNPTNMAVAKSINELGHVFGKRTIAEYVETPEILEIVRSLGIDYAQGYHIGMPTTLVAKPVLKAVK